MLHTPVEFQTGPKPPRLLALPPRPGFSIYHLQAPQDADFPYIIFNQQTGTPIDGMKNGSGMLEDELWLVKAVSRQPAVSPDLTEAKAIADRIDTLLKDAVLPGFGTNPDGSDKQRYFRRQREMPTFAEREEDQYYVHAGSIFRLVYE